MKWFREFRFLIIVYGLTLAAATWELVGRPGAGAKPPAPSAPAPSPPGYVPVLSSLYPDDAKTLYYAGVRALFSEHNPKEARRHFERAVKMGVKTDEQLLYYYAVTLILDGADQKEVDEAVANWRRNHPASREIDPRKLPLKGSMPQTRR
jgi:hypothetical protein